MGFLIKSFFVLLIIAVAGGFIINKTPSLKERLVEIVNPAAKESRILGDLGVTLNQIDKEISGVQSVKNTKDLEAKIAKSKTLLKQSGELLGNISDLNNKNSGIIRQQIGRIIDAFTDKTPYPADHLPATVQPAVSQPTCAPAN